jgi:hypothetical protein
MVDGSKQAPRKKKSAIPYIYVSQTSEDRILQHGGPRSGEVTAFLFFYLFLRSFPDSAIVSGLAFIHFRLQVEISPILIKELDLLISYLRFDVH